MGAGALLSQKIEAFAINADRKIVASTAGNNMLTSDVISTRWLVAVLSSVF